MCDGVHMGVLAHDARRRLELFGEKVLRSTLANARSLRSAVMSSCFVVTSLKLIERHSAVTIWYHLFLYYP
jgi:hypothetical protein